MIALARRLNPLLLPSIAVFTVLFLSPLVYFFIVSFWEVKTFQMHATFTFKNYVDTFNGYAEVGLFTFAIAAVIASITTFLAFGFAYVVRFKAGRFGSILLFGAVIALFGGYLAKVYAWKTILGTNGILNTALLGLGIIDEPIKVFIFNPGTVVVTLTHWLLPLAVMPIYGSLRGVQDISLEAARDLGAKPQQVFMGIILPQCRTGLFASFAFAFLISAGDYVTPRLVGGPSTTMIGNYIESLFGFRYDWPLGSAMAFSTLFCCVALLAFTNFLLARARRK
ncbi:MAG: ABC transporter permease [Proteobacteria bacterium]|nr:ABC transporter permease [Pseudomonadota bacterium]